MLTLFKKAAIIYGSCAVLLYGAEYMTGASSPAGVVNAYLNLCNADAQVVVPNAAGPPGLVIPRP